MARSLDLRQQEIGVIAAWRDGMNPEQLAVIDYGDGPLLVQAVAGSGKTRSLVHRIVRMVHDGVAGERICAVTFSNNAAGEMNRRLTKLGVRSAQVSTWHSLMLKILRDDLTPYATWSIDDRDKAKGITKRVLGYEYLDWKAADLRKVRSFITICKANFSTWENKEAIAYATKIFDSDAKLALDAYQMTQGFIENQELLTFDDMLVFAARHLLVSEEIRSKWASRWDHLLCDEFQDNSRVQNIIAEALVRDHRNYCAIGDCAQALYSFRGASPVFIMEFEREWGAARVAMVRNYRSGRKIVAVANSVIRPAKVRMPEEMIAERDLDGEVRVVAAADFDEEGREVARWAREHAADGGSLGALVVLYRTNAQSRAVEEAMLKAKILYRILGGMTFYDRREVKDLLGYLRVAVGREAPGDDDGEALRRCINTPFRYLGKVFVSRVMAVADGRTDWTRIVREASAQEGVKHRQKRSADEWATIMESASEMVAQNAPPTDILNWIVDKTGYIKAVEREEGEESIETSGGSNVKEMIRVAGSFETTVELLDFVDRTIIEAARQRRDKKSNSERVLLCSIHKSKGQEYPKVWVIGCNEGTLPHGKGDAEEERRIAYVAVTRAMDSLTLSYVKNYTTRYGVREGVPSRFLKEAGLLRSSVEKEIV